MIAIRGGDLPGNGPGELVRGQKLHASGEY
jgi:hypothetical protein